MFIHPLSLKREFINNQRQLQFLISSFKNIKACGENERERER